MSYSNESSFIDKVHFDYNKYSNSDNKTKAYVKKGYRFETNNASTQTIISEYVMKELIENNPDSYVSNSLHNQN